MRCLWLVQMEIPYGQWEEAPQGGQGEKREPAQRLACVVQLSSSPHHKFQGCVLLFITLFSLVSVTFQFCLDWYS